MDYHFLFARTDLADHSLNSLKLIEGDTCSSLLITRPGGKRDRDRNMVVTMQCRRAVPYPTSRRLLPEIGSHNHFASI